MALRVLDRVFGRKEPAASPEPQVVAPQEIMDEQMISAPDAAKRDIGRTVIAPAEGPFPRVSMSPGPHFPWTAYSTLFRVETENGAIEEVVYHPHLAMHKLLTEHRFTSVLDIGCGDGNEVRLFRHLASRVVGINADHLPAFKADFFGDYLDYTVAEPFDAIWCSHVLEHIRNPGAFLEKVFRDLNPNGVLVLSVPYHDFLAGWDVTIMGHHTRYNVPLLIYHLISAGFDCRELSYRVYGGQISIVLKKAPNGVVPATMAPYMREHIEPWLPPEVRFDGSVLAATGDRARWPDPVGMVE